MAVVIYLVARRFELIHGGGQKFVIKFQRNVPCRTIEKSCFPETIVRARY